MSFSLGIDTGGTYTDAVLLDNERRIVRAAKALTTHSDLAQGIGDAVARVLPGPAVDLAFVGLSTTLATNALVEGRGAPVGLLLIGAEADLLERGGLKVALGGDPVRLIAGGHEATGRERAPLDRAAAAQAIRELSPTVEALAVVGRFAVRNPDHELAVAALAGELSGPSCSASHELSSRLDAPRRAVTTLLNARLIPEIRRLILAVRRLLAERGILAPLMVMKGDGSLVAAGLAATRPVETILSGPAASLVGASFLSGRRDAVVVDVGGTTTDVAILRDGMPRLDPDGASVGGHRTMVLAIALRTRGLGGDSDARIESGRLVLGPRRAVPLSLLAAHHPEVLETLQAQLTQPAARPHDGRFFLLRMNGGEPAGLGGGQRRLLESLTVGPVSMEQMEARHGLGRSLDRLIGRGLVAVSAFTPSDAAHALGRQSTWSTPAAEAGAALLARRLGFSNGREAAEQVIELASQLSAETVALSALDAETSLVSSTLPAPLARALARPLPAGRLLELRFGLTLPLVALGGPAPILYPAVAGRLGAELVLPEHYEVGNAVGAVVAEVVQRATVLVAPVGDAGFRVHLPEGPQDLEELEAALALAERRAGELALARAEAAGAETARAVVTREIRSATLDGGLETLVEAIVVAVAIGRAAGGAGP